MAATFPAPGSPSWELVLADITLCAFVAVVVVGLVLLLLWAKRRQTRRMLEGGNCNLPTVLWRPRFVNYMPAEEEVQEQEDRPTPNKKKKMASSSITGILPRMERLGGPFGMYGTVYGVSTAVVHVAHPVPARKILMVESAPPSTTKTTKQKRRSSISTSSGATKAPAYNHFKDFSGNGVFTSDGDEWKQKRASVLHCLLRGDPKHPDDRFQRLEQEANRTADAFVADMQDAVAVPNKKNATAAHTNVVPLLQRATIGLIYRYITHDDDTIYMHHPNDDPARRLSDHIASEDGENVVTTTSSCSNSVSSLAEPVALSDDDLSHASDCEPRSPSTEQCGPVSQQDNRKGAQPTKLLASYLESVTRIRMIILAQSRSIWFLVPRWVYRTFSPMYREEKHTMGPIREFARTACHRAKPGSPLAMLRDRPSHSMAHHEKKSQTTGSDVLAKDLLDEAITLLFAGQDTSAATLSWTLHLLSLHPEVQTRLAEEVRSVLENTTSDDETKSSNAASTGAATVITRKQISRMTYLDAVIKESMRLYPVAPFVVRKLSNDVPIIDNDDNHKNVPTVLPAGALACIWIYGLHRNKELWDRPDDFVPDRWIDPSLRERDAGQQTNGAYMPFAAGPRKCVGQPMAQVILRIILARIINEYTFADARLTTKSSPNNVASGCEPNHDLRKDMQAGFTVLPSGGLRLTAHRRC